MSHDDSIHHAAFEVFPLRGLGAIRLGDSESNVRQTLTDHDLTFDDQLDPCCWEVQEPLCTLSFSGDSFKQLVQIVITDSEAHVFGQQLIGVPLHSALAALGTEPGDDTVWSMIDVDSDFSNGRPFVDSHQAEFRGTLNLLESGTLWIKSLGLGLSLHLAAVNAITIRHPNDVPQTGCGPLDAETLLASHDPQASRATPIRKPRGKLGSQLAFVWRLLLWFVTLLTAATLSWVIYTMVNDYLSWMNATTVVGKVVAMSPTGPFPEQLVVEYMLPDEQLGQTTIPWQYTSARELGQEVELVYRDVDPTVAMTPLQAGDHFSSLSFNWLIFLVPLFGLQLGLLFPHFNRRRRY